MNRRDWLKQTLSVGTGMTVASSTVLNAWADPLTLETAPMPKRELGNTGEEIPILLMGGDASFDQTYDKLLHQAHKFGVTYVDTSVIYSNGLSQKGIGNFVQQLGDRKKMWITSKVLLPPGKGSEKTLEVVLKKKLPDLQTDHLDMFFMHGVSEMHRLDPEYIRMGERLKSLGMIRHFGFSCHEGNVVDLMNKAATIGAPGIDAIQFRYSFAQYGDLELNKAIDACRNAGIGLIAMKTQASVPEDGRAVQAFRSKDFTLAQAKLKAVWADERIDAAVSSMTNMKQLEENVAAAKSHTELAMSDFAQLNQYAAATAHHRCLGCSHICEASLEGNPKIAERMRYLMYAECYGNVERAQELYRALNVGSEDFDSSDFARAQEACAQGIDISRQLAKAHDLLA